MGRLLQGLATAAQLAEEAEALNARRGLLQGLDARVKLVSMLVLIVAGVQTHSSSALASLLVMAFVLALVSRLYAMPVLRRLWIGILLVAAVMALPALFLVPGGIAGRLPMIGWPITEPGLRSAAFLFGRAAASSTFSMLLLATTPWPHVLKAMRCLGVPAVLVAVLGMAQRYIFLLLQTAMELVEARRSRILGPLGAHGRRHMATSAAGALFERSLFLACEVHLAMVSRGYRGDVRLLDDFHMRRRDWLAACVVGVALIASIGIGR